ncbi:zinc-binding protein [Chitinimonas sp. BJB300]|nr:zinc-binding protein [Chitinimonas sp. BJB300]
MPRLDAETVRYAASGRWASILTALGLSADTFSSKRNRPCPCCGGTDRFQWIDKDAGRFVCRALEGQGGDGFALVMHWQGRDFKAALAAVAGVLGLGETQALSVLPAKVATTPTKLDGRAIARKQAIKLARLWEEAQPLTKMDAACRYLAQRGLYLESFPACLRHHPALPYWCEVKGEPKQLGCFPALLAQVIDAKGQVAALHRTYLTDSGHKLALSHPETGEALPAKKLMVRSERATEGAAMPLYAPDAGRLALTEGLETALAVHLGSGLPVWACVSAGGLERVVLPDTVRDVFIFADHDASQTGQRAAERLTRRLQKAGLRVRTRHPAQVGRDWLDVFNQSQRIQPGNPTKEGVTP